MNTILLTTISHGTRAKRWRFNPLAHLTPNTLSRHLNAFEAGRLRQAAMVWDALEQRDDLLRTVISKRKKSVARQGWSVVPLPGLEGVELERAAEHARALEYFYNHLECEHAVDTAEKGGFKLLARQMMDAVGKRFAVHEIIWSEARVDSRTNRRFVSAKFRFVPLAFFENTTGRLRFLPDDSGQEGEELEPGAWMITVGEGLMIASSTAWMFKHLSLDDWLQCSQRNGTPALLGVSAAAHGSAEWKALEQGLVDLLEGRSLVHSSTDKVQVLDLMAGGGIPFPQLVERIDRMLAALWRGADLSTLSRDRGYGASLQEKETCALEEDDSEMLTETLNRYVDQWVIRHVFGPDEKPLARVKVLVAPRECTTSDLQVDEFLLRHGAPLSIQETMSRYGRVLPRRGEKVFVTGQGRAGSLSAQDTISQASLPESSQNSGTAEGMDNEGFGCGPTVSFRGCSPEISSSGGERGEARACPATFHETTDDITAPNLDRDLSSTAEAVEDSAGGRSPSPDPAFANQFTLLQEDWLQLSPYGDFPHARGIQRVDPAAADAMVAQFNSFRGRLGRLFGGVPFYVGHPDLPGASETADRKAYGWIMQIEGREDGLFGRVKWSESGLELLRNAHFKFYSPYWEAREIGSENSRRIYRPVALLSVGLTNQPNIPVRPLANAKRNTKSTEENAEGTELHLESAGEQASPRTEVDNEVGRGSSRASAVAPPMHTASCTEGLGIRKSELVRISNRRDRIHECVLAKMRLGLTYDQAWDHVKREHPAWFQD